MCTFFSKEEMDFLYRQPSGYSLLLKKSIRHTKVDIKERLCFLFSKDFSPKASSLLVSH